jgi:hypothetical protein
MVVMRIVFLYFGNFIGARIAHENWALKHLSWMGFVGQAGIAVGLSTIIENSFPGEMGSNFRTLLLASVVINELIGPILFKYLLVITKEAKIVD